MAGQSFLTGTSTNVQLWTSPSDFNIANNKVEVVGPGGNGSARQSTTRGGSGGGGGSYAVRKNICIEAGQSVGYMLPAGGAAVDASFCDLNLAQATTTPGSGTGWNLNNTTVTTGQTDSTGGTAASKFVEVGTTVGGHGVFATSAWSPKPASTAYDFCYYVEVKQIDATNCPYVFCSLDCGGSNGVIVKFADGSHTTTLGNANASINRTIISGPDANGWIRIFFSVHFTASDTNTSVTFVLYRSSDGTSATTTGTNAASFYWSFPMINYGTAYRRYNANTGSTALWAVLAKCGTNATTTTGGSGQSGSVGDTTHQGGNGVAIASSNAVGGGGGGAAGPSGNGGNASTNTGGTADNGTVTGGAAGSNGNSGTEWDATHGCGSGAGGGNSTNGKTGGNYGGGGSGADDGASGNTGGAGGQALIVYNYVSQNSYYLTADNSDITSLTVGSTGIGASSFTNWTMTQSYGNSTDTNTHSIGASATVYDNQIAIDSDPGTAGVTGNHTFQVNITTGSANVTMSVALFRVNSSGTIQTATSYSTGQTASAGVKTFSFTSANLGTFTSTDRFGVSIKMVNAAGTSQTVAWSISGDPVNSTNIAVPWSQTTSQVITRGATTVSYSSRTNTSVTPPNMATNDLLVACFFAGVSGSSAVSVTKPSGWSEVGSAALGTYTDGSPFTGAWHVYYKTVTDQQFESEVGSYTWTHTAASTEVTFYVLQNAATSSIFSPSPTFNSVASTTTCTGNTITPTNAGSGVIFWATGWGNDAGASYPTQTKPVPLQYNAGALSYNWLGTQGVAQATGNYTTTMSSNTGAQTIGIMIVIEAIATNVTHNQALGITDANVAFHILQVGAIRGITNAEAINLLKLVNAVRSITDPNSANSLKQINAIRGATDAQSVSEVTHITRWKLLGIIDAEAANVIKQVSVIRSVAWAESVNAIKLANKFLAFTWSEALATLKQVNVRRGATQAEASAQSLQMAYKRVLAVTQNEAINVVKFVNKFMSFAWTEAVNSLKQVGVGRSVTDAQSVNTVKQAGIRRSITDPQSTSTLANKAFLKAYSITQTQSVNIVRLISKFVTLTQTQAVGLIKAVSKGLSLTQTQAVGLLKRVGKLLGASDPQVNAVNVSKAFFRNLSATQAQAVGVLKGVGKLAKATQAQASGMVRAVGKIVGLTQAQASTLAKSLTHSLGVLIGNSANTLKDTFKNISIGAQTEVINAIALAGGKTVGQVVAILLNSTLGFNAIQSHLYNQSVGTNNDQSVGVGITKFLNWIINLVQTQLPLASKELFRSFSTTFGQSVSFLKQPQKLALTALTPVIGITVKNSYFRVLSVVQNETINLQNRISRLFGVLQSQTVANLKTVGRIFGLSSPESVNAKAPKTVLKAFGSIQNQTVNSIKTVGHLVGVIASFSYNLVNSVQKHISVAWAQTVADFKAANKLAAVVLAEVIGLNVTRTRFSPVSVVQAQTISLQNRIAHIFALLQPQFLSMVRGLGGTITLNASNPQMIGVDKAISHSFGVLLAQTISTVTLKARLLGLNLAQAQTAATRKTVSVIRSVLATQTLHAIVSVPARILAVNITIGQNVHTLNGLVKLIGTSVSSIANKSTGAAFSTLFVTAKIIGRASALIAIGFDAAFSGFWQDR